MKSNRPQRTPSTQFEPLEGRRYFDFQGGGALDRTFDNDGKVTIPFGFDRPGGAYVLVASDVAVQGDGKTLVGGTYRPKDPNGKGQWDFAVARLNFDGSLDRTFGRDGKGLAFAHIGKKDSQDVATSIALQADGKILLAGSAVKGKLTFDESEMAIARFLPNGRLDSSFAQGGTRFIEFGNSDVGDIAVQPDGKIVLVGSDARGRLGVAPYDVAVARLHTNGGLDKTFDGDGQQTFNFGSEVDDANAVAIDNWGNRATNPNFGKIVIAGHHHATKTTIALARLNSNGSRDTSFSQDGSLLLRRLRYDSSDANAVLVQPGGKIVVAGRADVDLSADRRNNDWTMIRFNPNGTVDTTFGGPGKGFVETSFAGDDQAHDIIRASDGGLLVSGTNNGNFVVARYSADGLVDKRFGIAGNTITNLKAGEVNIARTVGNRIVLAGGTEFRTARYQENGPNLVSVGAVDPDASEVPEAGKLIVTRTDRIPVPTRVFFSIGGTASAPRVGQPGSGDYTLSGMTVNATPFVDIPAGQTFATVTLVPRNDAEREAFETATFTVQPNAAYELGTNRAATIDIADNDLPLPVLRVNFQAPGVGAPSGQFPDLGGVFAQRGNLAYGWDADNTANARNRKNPESPDFRYDSLNHMQKDGTDRLWEVAVPNGTYMVRLVAGDPSNTDAVYKMNLEGRLALSGTPSGDTRFFRQTTVVQVSDGRLTLSSAAGAVNNRINFVEIKPVAARTKLGPVASVAARLKTPATAGVWQKQPSGLFADNQIDEPIWA